MSPDKLVDENNPSMYVGCQDKSGHGKIHEAILGLSSGQLFSESYQGKIVTGSVGSSLNLIIIIIIITNIFTG